MAALNVVQVVADDQVEVASKLETLLVDNSIDSSNINSVEIIPFGQNKFLIEVAY